MNLIAFQETIAQQSEFYLEQLQKLVEMESPSHHKMELDRIASAIAQEWQFPDFEISRIDNKITGDHLKIAWTPPGVDSGQKPLLVIGHFDTVWPLGTLAGMPFRRDQNCIFGPGTYDMKANIVLAWLTVRQMQAMQLQPSRPVVFLWTSDEEVGSQTSRQLIEEEARNSVATLVLEPPLANGAIKTARKGVGAFHLEIRGRAAHAGVEPEKGRSAVVEIAHQILKIQSIADPRLGTTLNVGRIGGGTANNVVPEQAWCDIDARVATMEEAARLERTLLHELKSNDPDVTLTMTGGLNRPPMVRSEKTALLFNVAREIASELNVSLDEGGTGGGSDGNFTAAAGCPTLDGLGLEGAGAHAPHEHIRIDCLAFRAALLAGLLCSRISL